MKITNVVGKFPCAIILECSDELDKSDVTSLHLYWGQSGLFCGTHAKLTLQLPWEHS